MSAGGSAAAVLLTPAVVNFVLLPLIGAAHGWLTNTLAVWLLFRPIDAIDVPLVGWRIQGVLPRRQPDLAHSVGVAVETELLSWNELMSALATPELVEEISVRVETLVKERVGRMLPGWVPAVWRDNLALAAANALGREAADGLLNLLPQAAALARERLPIAAMVESRILAFQPADLERVVRRAAAAELRSIVLLGLVMGLGIGLVQGTFLQLIGQ
jgi:uncharacterized membrane protein YheB (UPF0754 family)